MSKIDDLKTFPFTREQIEAFKKEINDAGGFENLMFKKKALQIYNGREIVTSERKIEKYKLKFLTGLYESLRPMYDTEIPYFFWNTLHEIILKEHGEIE